MDESEGVVQLAGWKAYPEKVVEFNNYLKRAFQYGDTVVQTTVERRKIEEEYSQRLTDLAVKSEKFLTVILPQYAVDKTGKGKKTVTLPYSYANVFKELVNTIRQVSESHRQLGSEIERCSTEHKGASVEQQKQCSEAFRDIKKSELSLDIAVQLLKEEKLKCRQKCAKAAKANECINKLPEGAANRAKLQQAAVYQVQAANNAKRFYETSVQRANEQQNAHYDRELPRLLSVIESIESNRIAVLRNQLRAVMTAEQEMITRIQNYFDNFAMVVQLIDPQADALLVPGTLRIDAGYKPYTDFILEDFAVEPANSRSIPITLPNDYADPSLASTQTNSKCATVQQDYHGETANELSVLAGETVALQGEDEEGWRLVSRMNNPEEQGYVPSYLLVVI